MDQMNKLVKMLSCKTALMKWDSYIESRLNSLNWLKW